MSEIHAQIGNVHGPSDPVAKSLGADLNLRDGSFDPNLYREPDYFVYIYTISEREFLISQPPLFPRLLIPAKNNGERVRLCYKIPHPFQQVEREGAIGDFIVRGHKAEQVAQSLLNPNNHSLNQDAIPPEKAVLGFGVDLNAQGVFWSRNNPPTPEEIRAAENRRERYYRQLVERARVLEISNPKQLEASINQDYHMAAEYFNIETSWHKKMVKYEECPNCGETIKPGVAYHRNSAEIICIINPERAARAGVVAPTAEKVSTSK